MQGDTNAMDNEAELAKTVMRGINKQAVGVPRVELGTSSLSATRSNQLSYTPGREKPELVLSLGFDETLVINSTLF